MRLKFISLLITGLIISAHPSYGQDMDSDDLFISDFHKWPRCGEIFPLSCYEGEMVLWEDDKEQSPDLYRIGFYDKYLPESEYLFEGIPELPDHYSHNYGDIRLHGSFIETRSLSLRNKMVTIVTPVPDGHWEIYHTNRTTGERNLLKSMSFAGGKITGDYVVRDTLGNILYRTMADTLGSWIAKDYHPSGTIRAEGEYRNGNRNGIWTWYDEKERVIIRETYRDGKYLSRLVPYDVSLNISVDDSGICQGFVILEEDDGSADTEYVYWGDGSNPVLKLRDTVGINLWFCAFGHAPLRMSVADAEISADGKRSLAVEPVKDVVYVGKVLWNGYPVEIDYRHHGYDLPARVSDEYGRINNRYYNAGRRSIADVILFHDFIPVLDKGGSIELRFRVDGEKKIVNVAGRSESLPARKLDRIVRYLQYMRGRQIPLHLIDHRNECTYSIIIENAVEYSPSQRRRSYKNLNVLVN